LPTLIRRTAPPAAALNWPPALTDTHRCGARALAAVHVDVPSLDAAVRAYRKLLGAGEEPWPVTEPRSASARAHVPLASGEIVLHEGSSDAIAGIVLGVSSLDETRAALEGRMERTDDVAWLDPDETFGLRLGFTELQGDLPVGPPRADAPDV